MGSLKVVCLISGGKDSLFSILHCLQNGHEVIALANLHPEPDRNGHAVEDLDSYMYQTIGHAVIPLYEKALGLPLYRQAILGTALNQDKCYGPTKGHVAGAEDETEALIPLLRKVQDNHPEVNAVSTGAILSDYQRTRVESVALRLELTPLSYLWQWPVLPPHTQASLLEDMSAVGQDSRIVKVASGGLDETFLWKNVADPGMIIHLEKGAQRFGSSNDGALLGEGGEYETLAVTGPAPVWKGSIIIIEDQMKIVLGEAGSATVSISEAYVSPHTPDQGHISSLRTPNLLEARFHTILDQLKRNGMHPLAAGVSVKQSTTKADWRLDHDTQFNLPDHILLSGLTGEGDSPTEQAQSIMEQALEFLREYGLSLVDVAYTSIILQDMNAFASVNAVYGSYFTHPNPPARVTIASTTILPMNKHLMVSLTCVRPEHANTRHGLHVQSRSYWAPANIGPYSQAISVALANDSDVENAALVYIAGQIPLVPASMELPISTSATPMDDFMMQTVVAAQHFERIGRIMKVVRWVGAIAFITASSQDAAVLRSQVAHETWRALHEQECISTIEPTYDTEADSFDVWDIKFGAQRNLPLNQNPSKDLAHDPTAKAFPNLLPPLYVIRVDTLPRGSNIEWVTYGVTGNVGVSINVPHFLHLLETFKHSII